MLKTCSPCNYEDLRPFGEQPGPFDKPEVLSIGKEELNELKKSNGRMQHDIFYLWVFLTSEDMLDRAVEYLEDHISDDIPFYMY